MAEIRNVTRAAEKVHLAQSSVSEQIQTLESEFGTTLFDRAQRGLELTAVGRRLLHYVDEILFLADEVHAVVLDAATVECGRWFGDIMRELSATSCYAKAKA